jgi:DDE superfamily endonuclease
MEVRPAVGCLAAGNSAHLWCIQWYINVAAHAISQGAPVFLYQKASYRGHKCCHGIQFQNVTTPDSFLAHLYGLIAGSCHDSYMLACSNLLPQIHALMLVGQGKKRLLEKINGWALY